MHYLWWWALDFAQDGNLSKYDAYDIKDATLWEGDESAMLDALIEAGFIDETDEGLFLHDWADYAGKLLERREKDRSRKRAAAEAAGVPSSFRRSSNGKSTEADGSPNASSATNQPEPTNEAPALQERRFAEFWKAYPNKVGKASCLKAWLKLKPTAELFDHIMDALAKQKASDKWQREAGRYIPNPLTWINQGRWDDEPVEAPGAASQTSTGTSGLLNKLREMYEAEGGDSE